MKAQEIYDILRAGGLSRAGALGMLGNLAAESTPELKPNIVQRGFVSISDEEYTRQVDNGTRPFEDNIGYGLAQFTFWSRKRALLSYAKSYGVSVGDGYMQVNFILYELRSDFSGLFKLLCESNDIDTCSDRVCDTYERPAVNNYMTRRNFAHKFEIECTDKPNEVEKSKERALELLDELREIINGLEV